MSGRISKKYNNFSKKSDFKKIIENISSINRKIKNLNLNKYFDLYNQVKLSVSMIKDYKNKNYTAIPFRTILLISATLLYFLNPFDVIPDIMPAIGYADDAALFVALFKSIQSDIEEYIKWKKSKPELVIE